MRCTTVPVYQQAAVELRRAAVARPACRHTARGLSAVTRESEHRTDTIDLRCCKNGIPRCPGEYLSVQPPAVPATARLAVRTPPHVISHSGTRGIWTSPPGRPGTNRRSQSRPDRATTTGRPAGRQSPGLPSRRPVVVLISLVSVSAESGERCAEMGIARPGPAGRRRTGTPRLNTYLEM